VNRLLAAPLTRSVRTSLGAVSPEFWKSSRDNRVPDKQRYSVMFMLPAYDATAIAMLGFGILAAGALVFGF
jgi:hypothetical protein